MRGTREKAAASAEAAGRSPEPVAAQAVAANTDATGSDTNTEAANAADADTTCSDANAEAADTADADTRAAHANARTADPDRRASAADTQTDAADTDARGSCRSRCRDTGKRDACHQTSQTYRSAHSALPRVVFAVVLSQHAKLPGFPPKPPARCHNNVSSNVGTNRRRRRFGRSRAGQRRLNHAGKSFYFAFGAGAAVEFEVFTEPVFNGALGGTAQQCHISAATLP